MKQKSQSVPLRDGIAPKGTRTQFLTEEITLFGALATTNRQKQRTRTATSLTPSRRSFTATTRHAVPLWLL